MQITGITWAIVIICLDSVVHGNLFYKDFRGQIFGPFPEEYIRGWWSQGDLTDDTPITTNPRLLFVPLREFFAHQPYNYPPVQQELPHDDYVSVDATIHESPTDEGYSHVEQVVEPPFDVDGKADSDFTVEESNYLQHSDFPTPSAATLSESHAGLISFSSIPSPQPSNFNLDTPSFELRDVTTHDNKRLSTIPSLGSSVLIPRILKHLIPSLVIAWQAAPLSTLLFVVFKLGEAVTTPILAVLLAGIAATDFGASFDEMLATLPAFEPLPKTNFKEAAELRLKLVRLALTRVVTFISQSLRTTPQMVRISLLLVITYSILHISVYPVLEARLLMRTTENARERLILDESKQQRTTRVLQSTGAIAVAMREAVSIVTPQIRLLLCALLLQTLMSTLSPPGSIQTALNWWPFIPLIITNMAVRMAPSATNTRRLPSQWATKYRHMSYVQGLLAHNDEFPEFPTWRFSSKMKHLYRYYNSQLPKPIRQFSMQQGQPSIWNAMTSSTLTLLTTLWLMVQVTLAYLTPIVADNLPLTNIQHTLSKLVVQALHGGSGAVNMRKAYILATLFLAALAYYSVGQAQIGMNKIRHCNSEAGDVIAALSQARYGKITEANSYTPSQGAGIKLDQLSISGPRGVFIQGINAQLAGGQIGVVYGGAGSGKTALLDALSNQLNSRGLWISTGAVLINGKNAAAWDPMQLDRRIYYLRQHEAPLHLPLDTAVRLATPDTRAPETDQFVADVLNTLGLSSDFASGVQTDLSDPQAPHLSPGKWRKLAIARALYHLNIADVLLMDVPLDGLSEAEEEGLLQIIRNKLKPTQIVVFTSNRMSTSRHADIVIDLDQQSSYPGQGALHSSQHQQQPPLQPQTNVPIVGTRQTHSSMHFS